MKGGLREIIVSLDGAIDYIKSGSEHPRIYALDVAEKTLKQLKELKKEIETSMKYAKDCPWVRTYRGSCSYHEVINKILGPEVEKKYEPIGEDYGINEWET